jgi:methyltransferase (TIGR00027 family)
MDVSQAVARTAFYCCLIRADDALLPQPVCGDTFASRFLDDEVRTDLAPLLKFFRPAAGNVARHRIIDDLVRTRLAEDPHRRIVLIGAGFDTRAYRLQGGRWFELDDPQLLAFKESRLPAAEAPNPLTRLAVTFSDSAPDAFLAPAAGTDEAVVIIEGVCMYLTNAELARLAGAIARSLPRATIICDLMSPAFFRRFSSDIHREFVRMGASFAERTTHPSALFEQAGYRAVERLSVVDRARQAGTTRVPGWLFHTVLRELRDGYAIWVFTRSTPASPPS